ncbi:MAG: 3-dehydroquinate synthase [Oscillospiraceae bacterium]|nr:3-dehydroquinate synthase [Oscillospiraceae bacterium]
MNTITVNASRAYEVRIGSGLMDTAGKEVSSLFSAEKCVIVTDDNVDKLYAEAVKKSIADEGIEVFKYVFPHGESSKCAATYVDLINFLAESDLSRSDVIVALGGGVTGDLAGFAAATYLRGINLVQIPTTLLAMVDSSVGGKTAIDLPRGKNLCGAFYQPHLVLCDTDALKTLPADIFLDGCAEVIKYGCLGNAELLEHLEKQRLDFDVDYVISTCVSMKRDVVNGDEFDRGMRQLLNLGHTAGHVIEKLSNFGVSHGRAVAMGMAIISESAQNAGMCTKDTSDRIVELIKSFGFTLNHGYTKEEFLPRFVSDKKRTGSSITAVIPVSFGKSKLFKMTIEDFKQFILTGVETWK